MERLDERDEALLAALERNARASVVALAREVGLSRSATQERLARLERCGAVAAYTVVRGAPARRAEIEAWLMVEHAPGGACDGVTPRILDLAGVICVHALAGAPDLLVGVKVGDAVDLDRASAAVRAIPGVGRVSTHLVLASALPQRHR